MDKKIITFLQTQSLLILVYACHYHGDGLHPDRF